MEHSVHTGKCVNDVGTSHVTGVLPITHDENLNADIARTATSCAQSTQHQDLFCHRVVAPILGEQ